MKNYSPDMKTRYFIPFAILMVLAFFGACISPEEEEGGCAECGEQQISILLAENEAPATRALSGLGHVFAQQIDRVTLIVCDADNKAVLVKSISDWLADSQEYASNNRRGRQAVIRLEEGERLTPGETYNVYAIGYHSTDSGYKVGEEQSLEDYLGKLKEGNEYPENLVLTLKDPAAPVKEIFAGSLAGITPNPGGGLYAPVILNRQVAGVYIYVKNVPYIDYGSVCDILRLVPAVTNTKLVLGRFSNEDIPSDGEGTKEVYVVNGAGPAASATPVFEIHLKDWFEDGAELKDDGEGFLSTEGWKKPDKYAHLNLEEGSFFAYGFVIPFQAASQESLLLCLMPKSVKEWYIVLLDLEQNYTYYYWDEESLSLWSSSVEGSEKEKYSLFRNHLYRLGEDGNPYNLGGKQDLLQGDGYSGGMQD